MRLRLLSIGLLAAAASVAFAQEDGTGPGDATPVSAALEEIVVTAGFRDASLMAAPFSATVLDTDDIESVAAEHLETVIGLSPNVTYSSAGSRGRFVQIRGIGDLEQFVDPKHYPSVGIALDDINLGGIASTAMLFDTERVEVLRGPQGTRFGTSALAGLVNVRSRAPTREFEGYVSAGVGEYGIGSLGAAVSGPLSQAVSARVAVQNHSSDGYISNAFLGADDTNGYDETTLRASLRIEPRSGATYDLTLLDFDSDNGYDAFSLDNTRTTLSDQPGFDRQQSTAVAARANWEIGSRGTLDATLTHLAADTEYGFDEDWTFVGICDGTLCDPVFDFFSNTDAYRRDRDETTLDVRWLGSRGDGRDRRLEYVTGLYLQQRDERLDREYYGSFASNYATERAAVYAQASLSPSPGIELTAGIRLESFDDDYNDSFGSESATDDWLHTGEIGLSFELNDASTLYGTLSRGEKAGGVNTEASGSAPFAQPQFQAFLADRLRIATETLTSVEVGLKGRYRQGRVNLRAAAFAINRDDAQLESWVWDGVNFLWIGLLDNVEGANSGVELELDSLIGEEWTVSFALGLLSTSVDSILTFDLDLNDFVERRDIDQAKSPDWQASVAADWRPAGPWSGRLELRSQDSVRFGYYHDGRLDGSATINASIARRIGASSVRFYARNLTDRDVPVHGLYFGNDPRKGWVNETYLQYAEPRVVGVELNYTF